MYDEDGKPTPGRGEDQLADQRGYVRLMTNSKDFLPFRPDLKEKAQDNRNNMNKPEAKLWYEVLRNKQMLGYRFLRQKPILNYILDFYCHKLKLGIEVDGDSHSEQKDYDLVRTKDLGKLGIKIIRFVNTDVMIHLDGVYWDIEKEIKAREQELGLVPVQYLQRNKLPSKRGDAERQRGFVRYMINVRILKKYLFH